MFCLTALGVPRDRDRGGFKHEHVSGTPALLSLGAREGRLAETDSRIPGEGGLLVHVPPGSPIPPRQAGCPRLGPQTQVPPGAAQVRLVPIGP